MNKHLIGSLFVAFTITISLTPSKIDAQTEADRTPLGTAVLKSDLAAVKELLSKGADPNKTHDQETPLVLATKQKNEEIFTVLVNAKGIKLDAMSTYIWTGNGSRYTCTALISAVHEMNLDEVKVLLDKGANPDLFDKNVTQQGDVTASLTALMNALILNREKGAEMSKMIIAKSKKLDAYSTLVKDGVPAIILSARFPANNEVTRLLVKKGAKLEMPGADNPGFTAIGSAIIGSNPEMVKFLIDSGAKMNDKKDKAFLHLSMAIGIENLKTIELLLDYGIDPNIRFSSSKYPVIIPATKCKNPEVLEYLISRGADVNAKDGIGQSVLKYANGGKKFKKNIAILKAHGAVE